MTPSAKVSQEVLRELHRLHRQLTDLKERLDQGPRRVRIAEGAATFREKELAAAQEELKRLRMLSDQKQVTLKGNETKLKDIERKLMAANSNREYQALKDQMAADKMANSVLEEEILDCMEQIDKQRLAVTAAEVNVKAAKQKQVEVTAEVEKEEPTLRGELQRIETDLKAAETTLPADIADFYYRGVRQKGEDALAPIVNSVCGGCSQTVPINIYSMVMLGKPTFCKTCGRLLYIPESAAPAKKAE